MELEDHPTVEAYAKNDHLFCEIPYRHNGKSRSYLPDFLVRLTSGDYVLIEGKGRQMAADDQKETAAKRWVAAVNADGRWGRWSHAVVRSRSEVKPLLDNLAVPAPA